MPDPNRQDHGAMTILVTGAGGFLGSHMVDRLLADGHRVIGLDNFATGRPANLEHLTNHERFTLLDQDVREPIRVREHLDGIMNLASPASPPAYQARPIETLGVGSLGTQNVLNAALEHDARLLHASTSEVYGDPEEHPQSETYWGRVNPIGERSMYDEAKRFAESLIVAHQRAHGVSARIARIFNTYGPRMAPDDGRVITNFSTQALANEPITVYGTGRQTRSFCYVDDMIEGLVLLFHSEEEWPVNLGNPTEHTIMDVAHLIIEVAESRSTVVRHPLPGDDPRVRCPDIGKAQSVLGWMPKTRLREGIRKTLESLTAKEAVGGGEAQKVRLTHPTAADNA